MVLGDLHAAFHRYYTLVVHIAFISDNHFDNVLLGVFVDVAQPLGYVVERTTVCYVVDEHDAHRATIVGRSDCVKALLACRVPVNQKA